MSDMTGRRAKLFRNGGSQAVRQPRVCCFPEGETEVLVRRVGRVILEPVDEWVEEFLECLGSLSEGIPRPNSPPITKLRDPLADRWHCAYRYHQVRVAWARRGGARRRRSELIAAWHTRIG